MIADMHIHTVASDGTDTAAEVVKKAAAQKLDLIAVTDHDTVAAVSAAQKAAEEVSVKVLAGIEISTFDEHEMHILGYNIDLGNPDFLTKLERMRSLRVERAQTIIALLRKQGIYINEKGLPENAGRVHIAKKISDAGYVANIAEAFSKYLASGKSCYVAACRFTPREAIEAISLGGGIAALAHPNRFLTHGSLESLLRTLKDYGLKALETFYPAHTKTDIEELTRLSEKFSLFRTGGSDYHGYQWPQLRFQPDAALLEALGIDCLTYHTERAKLS